MRLEGKLDWERFQATARKKHPLDERRFFHWRNFIDYNGGHMTDQGTHLMDVIQWFCNGGKPPVSAVCQGAVMQHKGGDAPDTFSAVYEYPSFMATWTLCYSNSYHNGWQIILQGRKATMELDDDGYRVYPEPWTGTNKAPQPIHEYRGGISAEPHVENFLASAIWLLVNPLGTSSWRYMFVIGIAPAFLLLYVRRVAHDPAPWVTANDCRREARKRIETGIVSEQDRELVQFTISRIFSEPELRRRVGLLLLMSLSTVVGWWSVSTWIPQHTAQLAAGAGQQPQRWASLAALMYNVGAIAGYLAFGLLADRFGRKPSVWLYYLGALGLSWLFFLRVNDWYALLSTAAANGFFTGGQFAWMTIYLPELFPARVRGSAISIVFDGSRSAAALGPLLAGWLASSFGGIGTAAAMMSLIYVVGLIVTPFAGPETNGKELRA
jgi:MFS family permease